jgi:FkbM family methyltransferase
MNIRTLYAKLTKKYPPLFDFSKSLIRRFEKKDPVYELLSRYQAKKGRVFFLQIGSNDGISNDPLREFIVKGDRWEGGLVEPLPHVFQQLKNHYRYVRRRSVRFRNAAISDQSGQCELYRVKDAFHHEMPGAADQVASFSKAHVLKHFPEGFRSDDKIETISVEVLTPSDLLRELALDRIDVLHLDVEGHERKILDAFPFKKTCPEIILFESAHLPRSDREHVYSMLKKLNFHFKEWGLDTLAIQQHLCRDLGVENSNEGVN